MSGHDLERLLTDALNEHAEQTVPSVRPVPPRRFGYRIGPSSVSRHRWSILASAAAIATVAALVVVQAGGGHRSTAAGNSPAVTTTSGASTSTYAADPGAKPVSMTFALKNGSAVGVGMPVIASFTAAITDGRALQAATHVTANGRALPAAWYFMTPNAPATAPLIGVLRPESYWPAHSMIRVAVDVAGLSAGHALGFRTNATLAFATGAADIVTVDAQALKLSLVRDGKPFGTYPVSLGIVSSPTRRGVKIITEKSPSACLHLIGEAGYHECGIKYVQRLTETGEYLLAAPWNVANIGIVNTTSGGTELLPADAQILFKTLQVGDPINYPNATGPLTSAADDGYWNVSWTTWRGGGLVPTH